MSTKAIKVLAGLLLAFAASTVLAGKPVKTGSLYIPNWQGTTATGGNVLKFDAATGEFREQIIPSLGADVTYGMTLGPDRNLYLSVRKPLQDIDGRILVYSLAGDYLREIISPGEGGLYFPLGLRFGPDGYLYVVNNTPGADEVLRFDAKKGRYQGTVGNNLVVPQDMVFGPDGLLYVTNGASSASSVYQFDPVDDVFLGPFVSTGSGGLQNPIGLAFGPDRNLYLASFPTNSVFRFDGDTGDFIDVFASVDGLGLDTPTDLVFGPDGNLYVFARDSTTGYGSVVRFDGTTGDFIDVFIATGSGGLGTSSTGMLFVDPGCARYGDNGFGNRCFTGGRGKTR